MMQSLPRIGACTVDRVRSGCAAPAASVASASGARGRVVRVRAQTAPSTGKAGGTIKVQTLSNDSFAAFGQVRSTPPILI